PVKSEKQRDALKFLQENILSDKSFNFPPELLRKLATEKWTHWGTRMAFGSGEYPVNQRVLAIQETVLDELLDPATLARIQNSARLVKPEDKPLAIAEVFRGLTDAIFADLPADGKPATARSSVTTRNLQRAYLGRLAGMVVGPKDDGSGFLILLSGSSDTPPDAKSLARKHLRDIGKRIDETLKIDDAAAKKVEGKPMDDAARAFLEESKDRIAKILNATVTANEP
ncbi:MAG: zinc-dependent metalloprotease, partial [Planctomycetia bacterium]|nr:zinc-dependent metalloprotease [Planctomycetia bacterium]